MGITRQMVHLLLAQGDLRACVYYERTGKNACYVEIAADDVRARLQSRGKRKAAALTT